MNSNYQLLDFQELYAWIQHRWLIMVSLLERKSITKSTKDQDVYEQEYVEFLNFFTSKTLDEVYKEYNGNKINRFLQSIMHDIEAMLYFPSGEIHFYAYTGLKYTIPLIELVKFNTEWSVKVKQSQQRNINTDNSDLFLVTCKYEDVLSNYRSSLLKMSPTLRYSREIKVGNQNITPLYLLEVHIQNCILSNSRNNFNSSIHTFLSLHLESEYTNNLKIEIEKFIQIIMTFRLNKTTDNIFTLYQTTKERNRIDWNLDYSVIAIANIILAAGDRPLDQLLPVGLVNASKELIKAMSSFTVLKEYTNTIQHVFDIDRLQLSDGLFNKFFHKVIIDYQLVTPTLTEPELIIKSLLDKSPIPKLSDIINSLERQFLHISLVNDSKCLLYRSKIIQMLILYSKSLQN